MSARIIEAVRRGREMLVCPNCAEAAGGVWPGRRANFWGGECDNCGADSALSKLSSWDFPNDPFKSMKRRRVGVA